MGILDLSYKGIQVRTFVGLDGVEWFHGAMSCGALGLSNPARTIQTFVFPEYYQMISDGTGGKPALYLTEHGVYQLGFASRSKEALSFQRWVFEEVLPKLRETGLYADKSRFSESEYQQLQLVVDERDRRIAILSERIQDQDILIEGLERRSEALAGISGETTAKFYGNLKLLLKSKFKATKDHFEDKLIDYLCDMNSQGWQIELANNKLSEYHYRLDDLIVSARKYLATYSPSALPQFDKTFADFARPS